MMNPATILVLSLIRPIKRAVHFLSPSPRNTERVMSELCVVPKSGTTSRERRNLRNMAHAGNGADAAGLFIVETRRNAKGAFCKPLYAAAVFVGSSYRIVSDWGTEAETIKWCEKKFKRQPANCPVKMKKAA